MGPANDGERLARIHVVVDGAGPLVDLVAHALRTCGLHRVSVGAYAVERLCWATTPPARRDHRRPEFSPLQEIGAIVAVSRGRTSPQRTAPWLHHGVLHLPVEQHPELLQVGPLVVPGASACLSCQQVPPSLLPPTSLDSPPSATPATALDPGVGVLAAAIAGLTIRQALLGDHSLAGVSCDVVGPRPEIVHRYWPARPDCACQPTTVRTA